MSLENGLEAALAATQRDAEAVLKASAALGRELKKARSSAVTGQVRDLRKALDAAVTLSAELAEATRQARSGFAVDEVDYLSSGAYAKELLAVAAEQGVAMFEEDERLLCYPSLLKLLPGDGARRRTTSMPASCTAASGGSSSRVCSGIPRWPGSSAERSCGWPRRSSGQGTSPRVSMTPCWAGCVAKPPPSRRSDQH